MQITPMSGFTFGCDPELFVVNDEGVFVSAEGLLPGTKDEPYKVDGGAIQVDGMAAEFNIDASDNFNDFSDRIDTVMHQLKKHLPKGYGLRAQSSVEFSPEVWEKSPDKAKELGCTPDFNAWTGGVNPPPVAPDKPRMRCAGGHVHIGWRPDGDETNRDHVRHCRDLVKQLDWYLGGWSVRADTDPARRLLYGKAGACRYKPYGVEYRVLSNFWVVNMTRRKMMWNRLQKAIFAMADSYIPDMAKLKTEEFGFDGNEKLIRMINSSTRDRLLEKRFEFPIQYAEPYGIEED